MTRSIYCIKLKREAEGFDISPYPGALGEKIFNCISRDAWQHWLAHQTMLINEHRLSMLDPDARSFLLREMEQFLFGEGSELPEGYVPPEKRSHK